MTSIVDNDQRADISKTSNFSVFSDRSSWTLVVIDNIPLPTPSGAASKWLPVSRYSFPLWSTARARIVIASSFASSHLFSPFSFLFLLSPFHLQHRLHFLSFFRHHRRSTHDPSIFHFPRKMNGANFRTRSNAARPVILHLPRLQYSRSSGRFSHGRPNMGGNYRTSFFLLRAPRDN